MVSRKNTFYIVSILSAIFMSSCSLTKSLNEGEVLYMGTEIDISDTNQASSVEGFKVSIKEIPAEGTIPGLLNINIGFFNIYDKAGDTGFRHWVKYKLGKKPVLFEPNMVKTTEAKLIYYLNGKGFFSHNVSCDSTQKKRQVNIGCKVNLGKRYSIDTLIFPIDSTYAALKIDDKLKRAILKEDTYYDRDRLDYERKRITKLATSIGFADFGAENVYYYADTTSGDFKVDLYMKILQPSDSTYHTRYTLEDIHIYPNYTLDANEKFTYDTAHITDNIIVHEYEHYLKHDFLNRVILQEPNNYYDKRLEQKSINRLLDLGLFKFINVSNKPSGTGKEGNISQHIYLTPQEMQSITGEFEINNRSGNYLGTGITTNYKHKNMFGGGEKFTTSLKGQVEIQFDNALSFINTTDINLTTELEFPRILLPFIDISESKYFIPRSVISASLSYERLVQYYTLQSALAKFGYRWRQDSERFHEFYPIVLNQLLVKNTTSEFDDILNNDARLAKSFDNVLIGGLQYNYINNNQGTNKDRRYQYFKGEVETSGNLLSIFYSGNPSDPATIGGTNYAQFSKITLDYRNYAPIGKADLASRLIIGSGFAYQNSSELPYSEQYIIGGSNSLRAFRLRGLGPGGFVLNPDSIDKFRQQFVEQTGDMKLELNFEYRFPIFRFLKGATFADMGNVWLIDNADNPVGNFKFDQFYKQIGIGTGFGIRLDFDFFLIRMDFAFPLREPIYNQGFQWTINEINPLSSSWRKEKLRYNLGIGYPF